MGWMRRRPALGYLLTLAEEAPSPAYWDWEATLERSYRRFLRRGARVVDVGGHTGRHTQVFVEPTQAERVWVFEPLPREFAFLEQRFGSHSSVRLRQSAVSSSTGKSRFIVNVVAPEESGLRRRQYNDEAGAVTEPIEVAVTTLDAETDIRGVDFVKIDVEGAEIDVLRGARELARRDRPIFSVEFGRAAYGVYDRDPADLYELAEDWDYVLTDLLGHPFGDRAGWLACVDRYYWDYLMIPAERFDACFVQLADFPWPVPRAAG